MVAIGFSDHVPLPIANSWSMKPERVEDYFAEIRRLNQKYAKQIEIYLGFEMDYLVTENKNTILKYIAEADYIIGAVHFIYDERTAKYYLIEGVPEDVKIAFAVIGKGNNRTCVEAYYLELIRVIREYRPNIIGHLDIIKRHNQGDIYFSENQEWYKKLLQMVLDEIALSKLIVEVSTGSILYNLLSETYPSRWILQECYQRNIPIILNSDAHAAKDIDGFFVQAVRLLRELGFTCQKILQHGQWVDVEL
jgi:histidinol-phosphatase (PHP family)